MYLFHLGNTHTHTTHNKTIYSSTLNHIHIYLSLLFKTKKLKKYIILTIKNYVLKINHKENPSKHHPHIQSLRKYTVTLYIKKICEKKHINSYNENLINKKQMESYKFLKYKFV